jgi:hypothetical protein
MPMQGVHMCAEGGGGHDLKNWQLLLSCILTATPSVPAACFSSGNVFDHAMRFPLLISTSAPSLAAAAGRYGDSAALGRLLQRGCPVDAADYDGRTLLHVAVTNKQQVGVQPDLEHIRS